MFEKNLPTLKMLLRTFLEKEFMWFFWQMTYYRYSIAYGNLYCLTLFTRLSFPSGRTSWRAISIFIVTIIWAQTMAIVFTLESKLATRTICSINKRNRNFTESRLGNEDNLTTHQGNLNTNISKKYFPTIDKLIFNHHCSIFTKKKRMYAP